MVKENRNIKIKVVFENEKLKEAYEKLSETDPLRKKIDTVIEKITEKPAFGQPIAKRIIPREYKKKGVDNAFWVELSKGKGWRLIYSLKSFSEIEIVAIILEWFTRHKDYGRRFKYE
ncbi:MAG: hypothetical protein K8R02_01465 [Anaerohalosphaeraceae bacterium]|nr:hypothetical protein [Anaerohalosphaeraceae bacterium]